MSECSEAQAPSPLAWACLQCQPPCLKSGYSLSCFLHSPISVFYWLERDTLHHSHSFFTDEYLVTGKYLAAQMGETIHSDCVLAATIILFSGKRLYCNPYVSYMHALASYVHEGNILGVVIYILMDGLCDFSLNRSKIIFLKL